jgi:N-acetylneuraminate lyase
MATLALARRHRSFSLTPFFPFIAPKPPDVETLVDCCAAVASAAPKTPFLYYHYPAMTGVTLPVYDFFEKAYTKIPNLRGAKFTSTELGDYFRAAQFRGSRYDILMGFEYMHLPCLPLGARGGISLSFTFCAPLYSKLITAYQKKDVEMQHELQLTVLLLLQRRNC